MFFSSKFWDLLWRWLYILSNILLLFFSHNFETYYGAGYTYLNILLLFSKFWDLLGRWFSLSLAFNHKRLVVLVLPHFHLDIATIWADCLLVYFRNIKKDKFDYWIFLCFLNFMVFLTWKSSSSVGGCFIMCGGLWTEKRICLKSVF